MCIQCFIDVKKPQLQQQIGQIDVDRNGGQSLNVLSAGPPFTRKYKQFQMDQLFCSLFRATLKYILYTQLHKMHGCAMKKCNQPSWPPLKIHSPMSALMLFICSYSSLTTNVDHRFDLKGKNNRGANREFIDFRTFHTDISTVEPQQFNHLKFNIFCEHS